MADINTFFKEPDSSLGIFYPKHYVIATLPSYETAQQAAEALRAAGIAADDVLALPPAEARQFLADFRAQAGVLGKAMTGLSRFLGDDATYADGDIERLGNGAGFLAVHSPSQQDSERIVRVVKPFAPMSMHWYLGEGIQSLI